MGNEGALGIPNHAVTENLRKIISNFRKTITFGRRQTSICQGIRYYFREKNLIFIAPESITIKPVVIYKLVHYSFCWTPFCNAPKQGVFSIWANIE